MESETRQLSYPVYKDFDMEIGLGSKRKYPVFVQSAAGEARETMHFPFDELALENQLSALQNTLQSSGSNQREQRVQSFGRALFDALFIGEVRSRYAVSQLEAAHQDKGLRLRLRIQSPQLATLPWEFMYDQNQGEYICLSSNTPIVRYLELPRPPQPLLVMPPLRILGMIAAPKNLFSLDIDRERKRVEKALKVLQEKRLVQLTWLSGRTWQDVQRAMRTGSPWHIFHFIGHGGFVTRTNEGLIAIENEEGNAHYLQASQLGRLLADHRSLRLVVLNSCEGAKGSVHDIFSSTAAILIRRGIPAVLAMQYEITDQAAIALSHTFYEALSDGWPVDAAVSEGRKAISLEIPNTVEWGTPVLYMRSPNGILFDVARTSTYSSTQSNSITKENRITFSDSVLNRQQDESLLSMADTPAEKRNKPVDSEYKPPLMEEATSSINVNDSSIWQGQLPNLELLNTLHGHEGAVLSVAFSPDGQTLGSGAHDESVRLWQVANRKPLNVLQGHKDSVHCIAFSPHGQILASGSDDKTIRLWQVANGSPLHILEGHTNRINSVAFSSDGQFLASGSGDKTVRIWRVIDDIPQEAMPFLAHTSLVHSVTFSPNGRFLASGSGYIVQIWRAADGALLHTLRGHTNRVNSIAFSPDGQFLASGSDDKTVQLWRVADGMLTYVLQEHTQGVNSVAFSPNGQILASGSDDKTIGLCWTADRTFFHTILVHNHATFSGMTRCAS